MKNEEPLLFDLFRALRREHLPLGVDEYRLALQVLWSGCGLDSPDDLRFTLRLLWAKSQDDQVRFDAAFDLYVVPALTPPAPSSESPSEPGHQPRLGPEAEHPGGGEPPDQAGRQVAPLVVEPQAQPAPLDEATVPLAARPAVLNREGPRPHGTYQFIPRLPISRREMAGIWRHLRYLRRDGPLIELDVDGTIEQISRNGCLYRPVMQPLRRNQVRLLMLIDCYDTMAPFTLVTQALVESARSGGLLGRMAVFYFSYVPDTTLSPLSSLEDPQPVAEVLATYARGASVLIVSDVGASRSRNSARPVNRVHSFLEILHSYTYRYAWLNPFPRRRWAGTTADEVQKMIPMFPLDRDGLVDAVDILRGHPFPAGVGLVGKR